MELSFWLLALAFAVTLITALVLIIAAGLSYLGTHTWEKSE